MSDSPIPWTATTPDFDEWWAGDTDSGIDPATDKVPDTLATIFAQQRALMLAVWKKEIASGLSVETAEHEWGDLKNRFVQARIHETYGHLVRELSEAMAHLDGSKSWKDKPRVTNVQEFHEEIADALHFFIELCILAGLDAEPLFIEYFRKSLVNFNRNASGY
jgi:NTP pyrophosphatase (non-canonical NTP hydrolase)